MDNAVASLISKFGNSELSERYKSSRWKSLDSLLPPPQRDEWSIVAESPGRVLVEIPLDAEPVISSDQSPFFTARIQLDEAENRWKITNILQVCVLCNLHPPTEWAALGDCVYCRGTGKLLIDAEPCGYCGQSGQCESCGDTGHPGWAQAYFVNQSR